jgi:hypothetical protein
MKRQEAVAVVKEISAACKLLNPKRINLESAVVGRYEIHIESDVDDGSWLSLKAIAKKYRLGVKLTNDILISYRPEDEENSGITSG